MRVDRDKHSGLKVPGKLCEEMGNCIDTASRSTDYDYITDVIHTFSG